jgi:hypothetical protein
LKHALKRHVSLQMPRLRRARFAIQLTCEIALGCVSQGSCALP